MLYMFSLPTNADKVPAGPDWLHEVKYDGYRTMLIREHNRVRLITRSLASRPEIARRCRAAGYQAPPAEKMLISGSRHCRAAQWPGTIVVITTTTTYRKAPP